MKKITVFIWLTCLTLSLAACGNTDLPSDSSGEVSSDRDEAFTESENIAPDQYAVGDIILADGSVVKEEELTQIDDSNFPIAVIAGFKDNGNVFGIGVHRSDNPLQWAVEDSAGYNGKLADNEENYPAFHFVNTYAEKYDLTGVYASGWYLPNIEELSDIYENREAVNTSLQKIYGLDNSAAMNGLDTNWYWSSSQADSEEDYAWFVHFFNGYAGECPKDFTNLHVLAVREF